MKTARSVTDVEIEEEAEASTEEEEAEDVVKNVEGSTAVTYAYPQRTQSVTQSKGRVGQELTKTGASFDCK
jgi:hypothetical protein